MKVKLKSRKTAITLVELLIAILLLSSVLLTAVSIELAMTKMQIGPTIKIKLIDELIPVVEKIKRDYGKHLSTLDDPGIVLQDSGRTLLIRMDDASGTSPGRIGADDPWYVFRWSGASFSNDVSASIEYFNNATPGSVERLAEGITYFRVTAPTSDANEAITVEIKKKFDYSAAEDLVNNPSTDLKTTIYSRGASLS
jgi:competence protein ComGC